MAMTAVQTAPAFRPAALTSAPARPTASDEPRVSLICMAEELVPCAAPEDRRRTCTLRAGKARPMPAPATIQAGSVIQPETWKETATATTPVACRLAPATANR